MKKPILFCTCLLISLFTFAQKTSKPQILLFVHGAWGGGWEYKKIDSLLRTKGDIPYHPTLTGLGERVHLANTEINLTTHINDIVNVFKFEDLHDVILVGHSYGGMVISGVAEQIPERIKQLVYLDAFVPENGESLFMSRGPNGDAMTKPLTKDGFISYPFGPTKPVPPTDVPQPLKTFTETLSITNPAVKKIPTSFILMTKDYNLEKAGFAPFAARAKARGWQIVPLEGGHYAMRDQPAALLQTLEKCK